jgi:hypothetical protein
MSEFDSPNPGLAKFAQKLKDQAAAAGAPPTTEPPQNTLPAPTTFTTPVVEAPTVTPPVVPVAAQPASVTPVETTTPPAPTVEETWDAGLFNTPPTSPSATEAITLSSLSSALKLEDIKSQEDLVNKFNSQETKIKELEQAQQNYLADLDEDFREVFQIAKQKGDWKGYLSNAVIDYSRVDPIKLFENSVETSQAYVRPDGSTDYEAIERDLAEIPLAVKRSQGELIKQSLVDKAASRKQAIQKNTEERRTQFGKGIAEAAKQLSTTFPQEKFGLTFEQRHGDFIYEGIRTGKLIEKHFGKIDVSGADPTKLARTIALAEWGENIAKHNFNQGKVKGQKELLTTAQNVQLGGPPIPPSPTVTSDKPKTAAEKLRDRASLQQTPGSL